ncbi:hypothetical protein [Candidatus Phytoplasma solani]|uniref:hypothetical protein n=1 Tax=Candidatus Phytoplasma solani TaxID=69896 RepID=UPI00358F7C01
MIFLLFFVFKKKLAIKRQNQERIMKIIIKDNGFLKGKYLFNKIAIPLVLSEIIHAPSTFLSLITT